MYLLSKGSWASKDSSVYHWNGTFNSIQGKKVSSKLMSYTIVLWFDKLIIACIFEKILPHLLCVYTHKYFQFSPWHFKMECWYIYGNHNNLWMKPGQGLRIYFFASLFCFLLTLIYFDTICYFLWNVEYKIIVLPGTN